MNLADTVLLILGLVLIAWGASLVLRAVVRVGLRRMVPFRWLFRGTSRLDRKSESVGRWRRVWILIGGSFCIAAGVWSLNLRMRIAADDRTPLSDVVAWAGAAVMVAFAIGAALLGFFADPGAGSASVFEVLV